MIVIFWAAYLGVGAAVVSVLYRTTPPRNHSERVFVYGCLVLYPLLLLFVATCYIRGVWNGAISLYSTARRDIAKAKAMLEFCTNMELIDGSDSRAVYLANKIAKYEEEHGRVAVPPSIREEVRREFADEFVKAMNSEDN
jgi:hypothetical protein